MMEITDKGLKKLLELKNELYKLCIDEEYRKKHIGKEDERQKR